jgi:SAM-dependent methyltransferase
LATFSNPRETWNDRYAGADFLFGEEPNAFLKSAAHYLVAGQSVLCVADGEGRNSVWLAQCGLSVTAFDFAPNAVAKARRLASVRGVSVDHQVADMESWKFVPNSIDALVAIFIQFLAPEIRSAAFTRMQSAVKPGGIFLLEGYTPKQLEYGTGGPGAVENLYTRDWVMRTFCDWQILQLREYDAELSEGTRHTGMSALIDLVARKTE